MKGKDRNQTESLFDTPGLNDMVKVMNDKKPNILSMAGLSLRFQIVRYLQ